MELPGAVRGETSCGLQRRWGISASLSRGIIQLNDWATRQISTARIRLPNVPRLEWPGLVIISGSRARPLVPELDPTAPPATRSLHLDCPALAVDFRVGAVAASDTPVEVWAWLGQRWKFQSVFNRWGGDFVTCANRLGLICLSEMNHFDEGLRRRNGPRGSLLTGRVGLTLS